MCKARPLCNIRTAISHGTVQNLPLSGDLKFLVSSSIALNRKVKPEVTSLDKVIFIPIVPNDRYESRGRV